MTATRARVWAPVRAQPQQGPKDRRFHEFASEWLASRLIELRPKTVADYRWGLSRHLIPRFGRLRLTEIGRQDVDRYKTVKLAEGRIAAAQINKTLRLLNSVLAAFGDDPPPASLSDLELLELFVAANEATLDANGGRDLSVKPSRTTLVVALITTERLQWASMGDSAIAVVAGAGVTWLGDPKLRFVGYPMDLTAIGGNLDRGLFDLGCGDWVVAVTDGFTDYVPRESRVVAGIASTATPAARGEAPRRGSVCRWGGRQRRRRGSSRVGMTSGFDLD